MFRKLEELTSTNANDVPGRKPWILPKKKPIKKPTNEAKLTTAERSSLPKSTFAGPDRSYPIPDKSHAANAKARASQAVNAGRMSKGEEGKIDAKANKVLGKTNEMLDEMDRKEKNILNRDIAFKRKESKKHNVSDALGAAYVDSKKKTINQKERDFKNKFGVKIQLHKEETMSETVRNIITAAMEDNAIGVQTAIHSAIGEKIQNELEAKRVIVAQNLVGIGEAKK